jgi:hypothetical protein
VSHISERPDPLAPPEGYGTKRDAQRLAARPVPPADPLQRLIGCPPPVWLNQDERKEQDGGCVVFSGDRRCERPAAVNVWIGCTTGEHVDKSGMCAEHAERTARMTLHCGRCWDKTCQVSDAKVIRTEKPEETA